MEILLFVGVLWLSLCVVVVGLCAAAANGDRMQGAIRRSIRPRRRSRAACEPVVLVRSAPVVRR